MPDLSDYLGHLLCEVTRARVMADREALRAAAMYADDPTGLLRTFPVPRMRLPDLEITVPVVVSSVPAGYVEMTPASPRAFAQVLADELAPALAKEGIHLDTAEVEKIVRADPVLSKGQIAPDLAESLSAKLYDHTRAAAKKARGAKAAPTETTAAERFRRVTSIIRAQIAKSLEALPRSPVGIAVDGRTQSVREIGNTGMVLNVKLVIKEESMEMLLDEPAEGDTPPAPPPPAPRRRINRLVPE